MSVFFNSKLFRIILNNIFLEIGYEVVYGFSKQGIPINMDIKRCVLMSGRYLIYALLICLIDEENFLLYSILFIGLNSVVLYNGFHSQ